MEPRTKIELPKATMNLYWALKIKAMNWEDQGIFINGVYESSH